jgi:shikimate dehydrogenase
MKRACVIGWPIEHSRSPVIHGYWLKKYGIDGSYAKEAVKPEDLAEYLRTLGARGFEGCNVTVPHKEAAFAAADVKHPSAVAVGAANTLWLDGGKLHAANTDTYGFITNLAATAPRWPHSAGPVVVLGAGGSARAVVYGFLEAGREDIRVFNRSLDRARDLAAHFGNRVAGFDWAEKSRHVNAAAVIVNTTTLGMKGAGNPGVDFRQVTSDCVVADLVYVPLETVFLKDARAHGLTTVDGLGMLLHQAVPGFEKWFGVRPEVTPELRDVIVRDIEGR